MMMNRIDTQISLSTMTKIFNSMQYVAVAIFIDKEGHFEDLLFEETKSFEEAKKAAEKLKKRYKDANKVIVLNRKGEMC